MAETSEPRPCPWCGHKPMKAINLTERMSCANSSCPIWLHAIDAEVWNDQRGINAAAAEAKQSFAQDVLDGCGCTGGTCWCIQHVAANLRGESVVENPEPMIAVKRVRDAVLNIKGYVDGRPGVYDEVIKKSEVLAAIEALGTGDCTGRAGGG